LVSALVVSAVSSAASFLEGFAGHADVAPFIEEAGAEAGVEIDGRGVPVEDFPLQARTVLFDGDGCDSRE